MPQNKIAVIKTEDGENCFGTRPFIALPREEIDRLHASIEVLHIEYEHLLTNYSVTPLMIFISIHYNYNWMACKCGNFQQDIEGDKIASLGFSDYVRQDDFNGLFLDDSLKPAVLRMAGKYVSPEAVYNTRLSGLINFNNQTGKDKSLALVYIVQLRQPVSELRGTGSEIIRTYGSGELIQDQNEFDCRSQILIDHITAF